VFTLIPDVSFDFLFGGALLAIFENSRLTKRAIDALTPRAKPFIAFDALRNEIIPRIDMDAWVHCQTTEAAERESLNKYIKAWPKAAAQYALRESLGGRGTQQSFIKFGYKDASD
jgi:hypothetical protein